MAGVIGVDMNGGEKFINLTAADVPGAQFIHKRIEDHSVSQLKRWLETRGLHVKGRKQELVQRCKDCMEAGNGDKISVGVDRGRWYEKKVQDFLSTRPSPSSKLPLLSRNSQDSVQVLQSSLKWKQFPSIAIPPFFCYGVIHSHIIGSLASTNKQGGESDENLADFSTLKPMRKGRQYFTSGHVSNIMDAAHPMYYFVKGQVRASYKDVLYNVSVTLDFNDSKVLRGTCQCKGSAMGRCSHIAALLFALEDFTINFGYKPPSCTSKMCEWNVGRKKRKNPTAAHEAKYGKKLPADRIMKHDPRPKSSVSVEVDKKACESFIATLPNTCNSSMFMKILENKYEDYVVTSERRSVLEKLSCVFIQSMVSEAGNHPHQLAGTEKQAEAEAWHLARMHRISASQCKNFVSAKSDQSIYNLIRSKLYEPKTVSTKEMLYGRKNEKLAFELYKNFKATQGYEVYGSGFWVNPRYPEMGCSPDGLVYSHGSINGIVEIKCPFILSSCKPLDIDVELSKQQQYQFCSRKMNDKLILKNSHKYYYQIQMQMAICEVKWCDFIIWSPKGMYVERVMYDDEFWMPIASTLKDFAHSLLIPEIFEMRVARKLPPLRL